MLQAEPMAPSISAELQLLVKRLLGLRENFNTLADDFGVHIDHEPMAETAEGHQGAPGLDILRTSICDINTQISLIEQLYDRLYAARAQLFGVGDGKWQDTDTPQTRLMSNDQGPLVAPIRKGDFRAH